MCLIFGIYFFMSTPTVFGNIQRDPGWQVIQQPDIAPNPAAITLTPSPLWVPDGLLLSITGIPGRYSGAVARSADYPIPPNTGNAVLTVQFAIDQAAMEYMQSLEMGFKLTGADGVTLNGQFQFVTYLPSTMTLDLTSVKGSGWTHTPFPLTKFTPNVLHTVAATYTFSDTLSIVSTEIDGVAHATPVDMLKVAGTALGWGKNKWMVNIQPNVNQRGGSWQMMIYSVSLQFS